MIVASEIPSTTGTARRLHGQLAAIRTALRAEAEATLAAWEPALERAAFRSSARNLADYLALRSVDLRPLQDDLLALGLSSLGRCEAHVGPSLDAVISVLAALAGMAPEPGPAPADFERAQQVIAARRDALFGPRSDGPETRVMVTLPTEAAENPDLIRRLIAAGADCVRINCAHDGPEAWQAMVGHTRAAAREAGREIRVAMDLGGPKVRIERIEAEKKPRLFRGDRFLLAKTPDADAGGRVLATLSHPQLIDHLRADSEIWIDDGKIGARVIERAPSHAVLEVTSARDKGVKLKPEKGVNLPGVDIDIPALTAADLAALDTVMQHADIVGFSFVQTPEDVRDLIAAMEERREERDLPALMLKIETQLAVRNLPRLIVQAGGALPVAVMIARGDLAVEIGLERMSEIQEELLWLCEAAQVPVVWATQVLDGLLKEGHASRAEATDAAMSQRAECVMLNKGAYLPEAVQMLRGILGRMDRHQSKKMARLGPLGSWRARQEL
ncbi:pyruvate kinase [Acidimangrovimonas pyrenivorans]|uniref:Pyruvate kinase n=1 Tax=Acidimangrovimonas pyrenivorans TaxID=2030798 RepID=A0ABV7ALG8_9RHOB